MKALVDQNRSFRLVDVLVPLFPRSCHVQDVGLAGEDDERIWRFSKDEGFTIVTKDNDCLARALEQFVTENTESLFMLRG